MDKSQRRERFSFDWFSRLYDGVLLLLGLAITPRVLYQMVFRRKYIDSLLLRTAGHFPAINKNGRPLVWVHAVSVGEIKAVTALIKVMRKRLDNPYILVTTVTETGQAEARRSLRDADLHMYLPLDFSWNVKRVFEKVKPDVVLLCETDFWYHFLKCAQDSGAFVALVNGKVSEKSMQRYRWLPWFSKRLFSTIDLFCVQSALYSDRFCGLGVPKEKIVVTGNLKFDTHYPRLSHAELDKWKTQLGIEEDLQVLVVGSTHHPEEQQLLSQLKEVWARHPLLKVILVPRHPERFNEVATLLTKEKVSFVRLTEIESRTGQERVILLDAMGLLRQCYQLATIAIVCGTYTAKIGGHNLLEPCWYGVPVLFGPHTHQQPDMVQLINAYQAGLSVPIQRIATQLNTLLENAIQRQRIGNGGLRLAVGVQGAALKTWNALHSHPTISKLATVTPTHAAPEEAPLATV